jgi:hypothetical protein
MACASRSVYRCLLRSPHLLMYLICIAALGKDYEIFEIPLGCEI